MKNITHIRKRSNTTIYSAAMASIFPDIGYRIFF